MFKVGIAREIITPPRGLPLVGYFNPRPNQGVLDDLQVRVLLFEQDGLIGGLVTSTALTLIVLPILYRRFGVDPVTQASRSAAAREVGA